LGLHLSQTAIEEINFSLIYASQLYRRPLPTGLADRHARHGANFSRQKTSTSFFFFFLTRYPKSRRHWPSQSIALSPHRCFVGFNAPMQPEIAGVNIILCPGGPSSNMITSFWRKEMSPFCYFNGFE